jgi:hypothetical protein
MSGHDWSTVMEFFRTILAKNNQPVPLDYVIIYTGYDERLLADYQGVSSHKFNETFLNECAGRNVVPLYVDDP